MKSRAVCKFTATLIFVLLGVFIALCWILALGGCQSTTRIQGPSLDAERERTEPPRYRYEIEIDIPREPSASLWGTPLTRNLVSAAFGIPAPARKVPRDSEELDHAAEHGSVVYDAIRAAPPGSAVRVTVDGMGSSTERETVTSRGADVRTSSDEVASDVELGGSRWALGWFTSERDASGFSIDAVSSQINFFTILGGLVTLGGVVLIALPPHRWTTGGWLVAGGFLMGLLGTLFEDHPLVLVGILVAGAAVLWVLIRDSRAAGDQALALDAIVPAIEATDAEASSIVKESISTRASGPREPRIRGTIRSFKTRNKVS